MIPLLLCLSPAFAYGEKVHAMMTQTALAPLMGLALAPKSESAQVEELLAVIDTFARNDPQRSAAWIARYPAPADFDRWAFKELLMLNPDAEVYGVDRFDDPDPALDIITVASRWPDDDHRNRDRVAHTPDRQPRPGVPDDPCILNMGKLGALSSQAHAHYGLDQVEFSSDPDVLKADPPRFAVAAGWPDGPILTFAPEMAQNHVDVATLAFLAGHDGLGYEWFGAGMHYVEDVSNPIHTVQVGLYDFFQDAFFERLGVSAGTGGGYFGELPTLATIGIGILTNHHTISEQLTEKRLLAKDAALQAAIAKDDPELLKLLPASGTGDFAFAATRTLIHASAPDGGPMYASTRAIVDSRYRRWGVKFDDAHDDPDAALRPGVSDAEMATFMGLQERAFTRGSTTIRALWKLESGKLADARVSPEATEAARTETLGRLVDRTLKLRTEADARLAKYEASQPAESGPPPKMPGMLAAEVVGFGLLGFGLSRGLRKIRKKA